MSYFDGLDDKQVAELVREDFSAARRSRAEIEQRKLETLRLYRRFRKELSEGGKGLTTNGPFGWSRLSDPLIYWIVETILPRVGINPPTITVTADVPMAVPFQQAKQLRINRQMKQAHMEEELMLAIKQFLLFGDGPVKTPWDEAISGPKLIALNWFDWFVSPDAERWSDAEVLYQRTWHTQRSLRELAELDRKRDGGPLYDLDALERVASGQAREADDETYAARRDAAGLGTAAWPDGDGPIALVEAHYRDGSIAVIAGDETPIALRIEREPLFLDQKGRPYRIFSVLQNTPDLFMPYGISDAEMVEDHQHESTTIRNQAIDQATGNLNAPKGYNRQKISPTEIQAAWSQPNGLFGVDGNPNEAVVMFPPGQLTSDVERMLEMIRRSAQEVVGVSDIVQGLQSSSDQTATEIASLREEANMRFRFKIKLIQMGMERVAKNFDCLDRHISQSAMSVPLEDDFAQEPGSRGITPVPGPKPFARVDTAANAPGLEYQLSLDAGSMAPPAQAEQANKVRALISDLGPFADMVNKQEAARMLVEAHGFDPDRLLMSPEEQMQQMMQQVQGAMPPGGPGAPPPGPGGPPIPEGPPPPGEVMNGAGAAPVGAPS